MIKKLSNKKDEEKRRKRNQTTIGIILVLLMVFSTFGIIMDSISKEEVGEKLTYNGLELIDLGSYYELKIGDHSFYFSENPNDLSGLDYEMNITKIITSYSGLPLYVDSKDYQAIREIYQNVQGYPLRIQEACLNEGDCASEDLPIKACDENMIIIREGSENKIYEKDSCVFIEGKKGDLLKLTDIFLLRILGLS